MEKFFKLFIVFFAISTHCFSQNKSGLLVGAGIRFENITVNTNNIDFFAQTGEGPDENIMPRLMQKKR